MAELMEEAVRLGADVVGGIPHFEFTWDYGAESVRWLMELAYKNDRLVDVHCDEIDDPESRFPEVLAAEAYPGLWIPAMPATLCQGLYNDAYRSRLFLAEKSGPVPIHAHNLHLQGRRWLP